MFSALGFGLTGMPLTPTRSNYSPLWDSSFERFGVLVNRHRHCVNDLLSLEVSRGRGSGPEDIWLKFRCLLLLVEREKGG